MNQTTVWWYRPVRMRALRFAAVAWLVLLAACHRANDSVADSGATDDLGGADFAGADLGTGAHIKTVFIIMMENHSWSSIKASASATYINGTLLPMSSHAEMYFTPPGNHPSEPNYIWLEAGGTLGISTDDPPSMNHQATTEHLVSQLDAAGVSWRSYQEGITDGTCPLTAAGLYDPKHNPMVYFDDVTDTLSPTSAKCIAHMSSFTKLATDLGAGTVARYNFITPNLCNDMHGQAFGTSCQSLVTDLVKLGDTFLSSMVPSIMASTAYKDGGAIFILWDEGDEPIVGAASDGPIGAIVVSPLGKGGDYAGTIKYTHSSTLRTVETIFSLPFLRDAATATDLRDLFTTFP
jgi:phospholipase C